VAQQANVLDENLRLKASNWQQEAGNLVAQGPQINRRENLKSMLAQTVTTGLCMSRSCTTRSIPHKGL